MSAKGGNGSETDAQAAFVDVMVRPARTRAQRTRQIADHDHPSLSGTIGGSVGDPTYIQPLATLERHDPRPSHGVHPERTVG